NKINDLNLSGCINLKDLGVAGNSYAEIDTSASLYDVKFNGEAPVGLNYQIVPGLKITEAQLPYVQESRDEKGNIIWINRTKTVYKINFGDYFHKYKFSDMSYEADLFLNMTNKTATEFYDFTQEFYNTGIATYTYNPGEKNLRNPSGEVEISCNTGKGWTTYKLVESLEDEPDFEPEPENDVLAANLKFEALGSGIKSSERIICDITDTNYIAADGYSLTEQIIADYDYSTYGKLGLTADGNSRLILRLQSDKPGYVFFSMQSIGAGLESLTSRTKLNIYNDFSNFTESFIQTYGARAEQAGELGYQYSAVLIAPEKFPSDNGKNFPSDNFVVRAVFYADDGSVAVKDIELEIQASPVLLIHGYRGSSSSFGVGKKSGIWHVLTANNFNVRIYNYDGTKGPTDILARDFNGMFRTLDKIFDEYNSKGIECTRADLVCHGMGGLIARKFTHKPSGEILDDGNNWSTRAYQQGMIRRIVTVATPHRGSEWADLLIKHELAPVSAIITAFSVPAGFVSLLLFAAIDGYTVLNYSALRDLVKTEGYDYGFPSNVPMYSIYGDVSDNLNAIANYLQTAVESATALAEIASFVLPVSALTVWGVALAADITAVAGMTIISTLNNVIFNSDGHDLMVSVSSAANDFYGCSSEYKNLNVLYPLNPNFITYMHANLCYRDDVANEIV
ncbi:MAG: hypothetical protein IJ667_09465, partial [Synergistaceae bacterium]|nr:hypothetical protein [Synergistaceae bacterium]